MQDYNFESVGTFDRNAAKYAEKYFSLRDYDQYYQLLVAKIPGGSSRFLDLACGPGNVAAYVRERRPDAEILCIDRAPLMLEEVRRRIAGVDVWAADCRDLREVTGRFHAAAFFFGLSYFDDADAAKVLAELHRLILPGGSLLVATVAGDPANIGPQTNTAGDRVFSVYRPRGEIERLVQVAGFGLAYSTLIASPANASVQSNDVVLLAERK